MHDEAWNFRQEIRERSFKSSRRREQILMVAEKADDINHADFANAPALTATTVDSDGAGSRFGRRVVAIPYADGCVVGVFESGQGVGDGGRDGERPQCGFGETEVGYLMSQQAHFHAKLKKAVQRKQERKKKRRRRRRRR